MTRLYHANPGQRANFAETSEPLVFTDDKGAVYFKATDEWAMDYVGELLERFFPNARFDGMGSGVHPDCLVNVYIHGVEPAALHWAIEQMIGES